MVRKKKKQLKHLRVVSYELYSDYLERAVAVDAYIPAQHAREPSLLLINDGQDLPKMPFDEMLDDLLHRGAIEPLFCVGIHGGPDRLMEYGTAFSADFEGRGARAGLYHKFVMDELLPQLREKLAVPSFREKSFAGFSLGGLSALDLVWNHASEFRRVGVFSGSLWWRRKAYENGYNEDRDRLMHLQVKKGRCAPWLQFFIECGTEDETADRNNNGIIDSIDDATDLMDALRAKGYTSDSIHYLELEGGRHDVASWARAFPYFLQWGWSLQG